MSEDTYEYSNFKVDPPRVDDGWYLVKNGITYKVDLPMDKTRFTKRINILTGEIYYPSNADRIRAMTDEDLARWIEKLAGCGSCPGFDTRCDNRCMDFWLDWLKQEAGE